MKNYCFLFFLVSLYSCQCTNVIVVKNDGLEPTEGGSFKENHSHERENEEKNCENGSKKTCTPELNAPCHSGYYLCKDGFWEKECRERIAPKIEECNGKDDDCDGRVDENISDQLYPCYEGPKGSESIGLCKSGFKTCLRGGDGTLSTTCFSQRKPAKEVCDTKDNDCDGLIDEGDVCGQKKIEPKEVFMKEGEFLFGDPTVRTVTTYLTAYSIDRYEVTNKEYKNCVEAGSCSKIQWETVKENQAIPKDYWSNPLYENYPVVGVSHFDAISYCFWQKKELPTQAQWERAAKGSDNKGFPFPWGEQKVTCGMANIFFFDREPPFLTYDQYSCNEHPALVGSYPQDQSQEKVFDLIGNVQEWVLDCYSSRFIYSSSYFKDPVDTSCPSQSMSVRGGSWKTSLEDISKNQPQDKNVRLPWLGFRCVKKN